MYIFWVNLVIHSITIIIIIIKFKLTLVNHNQPTLPCLMCSLLPQSKVKTF